MAAFSLQINNETTIILQYVNVTDRFSTFSMDRVRAVTLRIALPSPCREGLLGRQVVAPHISH